MPTRSSARNTLRHFHGYQFTQALYVAAKLGVADLLDAGPRSVDDLAAATSVHGPSLYRLLRALCGFGVFTERPDRVFELGPLGVDLRQGPNSALHNIAIIRGEVYYRTWGNLLYSIQTGKPAFDRVFGRSNWEYRRENPEADACFNAFMSDAAQRRSDAVLSAYDFPDGLVVDVGGGLGTLLRAILERNPTLQGILFDQAHVIERARQELRGAEVLSRCALIAGDFFCEVPTGGAVYILSAVLHDWDDTSAGEILRRCRNAMVGDATLLIIERVMPPVAEPSPFLSDLDMLVNTGGRERDEVSWRELLDAAGFRLVSVLGTSGEFYILRAALTHC